MSDYQWVPKNDLEREVVAINPEHNFIFGTCMARDSHLFIPRPREVMETFHKQQEKERKFKKLLSEPQLKESQRQKLRIIHKMQSIAGTKALDELPSLDDWNSARVRDRETVAMMRHCGLQPSLDQPLDPTKTIATRPISKKIDFIKTGDTSFPIYYDEKIFEITPQSSLSDISDDDDDNDDNEDVDHSLSTTLESLDSSTQNLNCSLESNFSTAASADKSYENAIYMLPTKKSTNCGSKIPYKLLANMSITSTSSLDTTDSDLDTSFDMRQVVKRNYLKNKQK